VTSQLPSQLLGRNYNHQSQACDR